MDCVYSQDIDRTDVVKYEKAFEYILNDSIYIGKNIFVSNLVSTNVPRGMFRGQIKSYPMYSEWLDSICDLRIMDEFRSNIIEEIFAENNSKKRFDNILFFSTIDKNTLMAFVSFDSLNKKLNRPNRLVELDFRYFWFNISIEYLFFFDGNSDIEKAVRIQIGG
jgi:hypothetical protein